LPVNARTKLLMVPQGRLLSTRRIRTAGASTVESKWSSPCAVIPSIVTNHLTMRDRFVLGLGTSLPTARSHLATRAATTVARMGILRGIAPNLVLIR